MSSTARKVGANENPDHRLDELQLRDRCIGQLGGPPEEQTDSVKGKERTCWRQNEDCVEFTGEM